MSNDLDFTYRESLCRKNTLTSKPLLIPTIFSISSYFNRLKGVTIISIYGTNFREYSVVYFGKVVATSVFFNSENINIYIPQNYETGTYAIQVINDQYDSNIVNYTLS